MILFEGYKRLAYEQGLQLIKQGDEWDRAGPASLWRACSQARLVKKPIDWMHKWRPKMYSFVYVLMRLTSLALKQHFFCILSMQTRLVRLIST